MIAEMRKTYLLAAVAVVALIGYYVAGQLSEQSKTCAPIGVATRVVVHLSSQGINTSSDRLLTDPEQISQLTAFANARRKCSQPSTYTMPAPQVDAVFYDKAEYLGSIGSGPNFFFVGCQNWRGIRSAKDSELKDFERLTGGMN